MTLRDEVAADLYQAWVDTHPTSGLVGVPFAQAREGLRAYWLTFVDGVLDSLKRRGYGLLFGGSLHLLASDPIAENPLHVTAGTVHGKGFSDTSLDAGR
jgi:hypothetical protein